MKKITLAAACLLSTTLLAGCGEEKKSEEQSQAAPTESSSTAQPSNAPAEGQSTESAAAPAAAGSGGELHIYNWSDYIGETTVADFAKMTGINVTYDVYDSNETLEAKLMAGSTGYDLVVPTGPFLGKQIQAGIYQKIDKSKLKNYGNLDPQILEAVKPFDPTNEYAIPYFWGTVGIGVNIEKVKERLGDNAPIDSFDLIMKPENAQKLADCGIAMLDSPSDILQSLLKYIGKDPHSDKDEDYEAVAQLVSTIKPYIKYFHSSQYINDLANGELCAVIGWSGDVFIAAARAEEAGAKFTIDYHIPKEGSLLWVDSWAIPKDAKNVDNALKFLDYTLEQQVAANGVNYVNYASADLAALPLVNKEIAENPAIYPTEEVKKNLFPDTPVTADLDRLRTRIWTKIKTGQ